MVEPFVVLGTVEQLVLFGTSICRLVHHRKQVWLANRGMWIVL